MHGVPDINDAGLVILVNNLVSESYQFGLNLVDGYMYATVLNTGYYDNAYNKNWEFEETNPVIETHWPYQDGTGWLPICYLDQNSSFIDAGEGFIEDMQLINKTTDVNGSPDRDVSDIGFHYWDSDFSNSGDSHSLAADFDKSMRVNSQDLAFFAQLWQQSTQEPQDLDGNGFVDFNDLSIFCDQWLGILPLGVRLDQDPNSVSDVLLIELVWPADDLSLSYYLFMDAQYLGRFFGGDMEIPTYEYRNGSHQLKVVGVSLDDEILVAPAINITVNNRLQCLTGTEAYKYNHAYQFGGFYEPNDGSTIDLTIKDFDENVIWASSSAGNFNFVVPAGVLQAPYNELVMQELAGRDSGPGDSWPESWIKEIVKEFDVTNDPCSANARSLLVAFGGRYISNWPKDRKPVWTEYLTACGKGNFGPTICLFFGQATRENIKTAMGLSRVKSVMIITDGGRKVGKTHRTFFQAADGLYFSFLKRNWRGDPDDYEPLPEGGCPGCR